MIFPCRVLPGGGFFIDKCATTCDNKGKKSRRIPQSFLRKGGAAMKNSALPAALCLLLCACAPALPAASDTPETAVSAPQSDAEETAAPDTPEAALPAGLEAAGTAVLPYDDIRLVYHLSLFSEPVQGYFTMCQDGQWGLMHSDGTEVLPCVFDAPIALCSDGAPRYPAWIARKDPDDPALREQMQQTLAAAEEGLLCDTAHCGPGYEDFFWLESSRQLCAYIGSLGPSTPTYISPGMQAEYGYIFPTRPATLSVQNWGYDLEYDSSAPYRYCTVDGTPLNNYEYQQVGFFRDGALLAPARRGSQWVYLDQQGNEVTAPCYDAVYTDLSGETGWASPLLSGYAVVSRDGKLGLLDSAGLEFLPCQYEGLVWDGTLGWLQQADGWHAFSIPSAAPPASQAAAAQRLQQEPELLRYVPLTMVYPDVFWAADDSHICTTITYDNLNVRAGPGTEYEKIGGLPPGSTVEELGASSTAPGWSLVAYQNWPIGWVSKEYLH